MYYLSRASFVDTWIAKHRDHELIGLQFGSNLHCFIGMFYDKAGLSFDHMVIELESLIDPDDVFKVIALALSRKLVNYTSGVFTLVE